ncbi:hypothetical protein Dimus_009456 [Dionaea muscipula]
MANDTDVEEFVVLSKVRAGHKREFAFALKSRNEVAACLGRTRVRKKVYEVAERVSVGNSLSSNPSKSAEVEAMDGGVCEAGGVNRMGERMVDEETGKKNSELEGRLEMESEEDPKSDVLDVMSDDDNRSHSVESRRKDVEDAAELTNVGRAEVLEGGMGEGCLEMWDATCCSGKRCRESAEGAAVQERPLKRFTESASKPRLMETGNSAVEDAGEGGVQADNVGALAKKVSIKMPPTKLKDLLETGLLEGLSVRYMRSLKTKAPGVLGLRGVINGSGILCYCDACLGTKVVSPNLYELHAGSSNKRPADYIYLENGNTLREVLNACKGASLDTLEAVIRRASGHISEKSSTFCVNRKCEGSSTEVSLPPMKPLSNVFMEMKAKEATPTPKTNKWDGRVEADVARKSLDCTGKLRASSGTKSQGRVTRKDLRLHKLVFENDILPDGTELGYYACGKMLLSGYKKGLGIFCMCCQKEVSPSQFEAHAGWASRRKPYLHIYTSNGVSLHELSISLSRTRESSVDENDDLCGICFDMGELLCCDGCPRAFHAECISVQTIPPGKWYCRYCVDMFEKEKSAERNANAIAAGRVAGVDPLDQISRRCIRIVKTLDSESSCCVLCRGHDFCRTGFGPRTVIICEQCEKEYHVGCLRSHKIQDLKELPEGKWFCSSDCNRIHSALQQLIVTGEQELPESLVDVIYKKYKEKGSGYNNLQLRWRLLSGNFSCMDETRLLLSKAVSVFHEQFDPILNPNSAQDLIPHMVYGRDVKDRELRGMYCAILSVNSIVVSAVVFRIFGKEAAEIPLVATSSDSQGKGYFQSLYACIESLLRDLEVKTLLLPAAEEARSLWTNKFGFSEIQQNEFNDLRATYNLMTFNGTAMLQKLVPRL